MTAAVPTAPATAVPRNLSWRAHFGISGAQGPTRAENNYRDYDEPVIERVRQIRELLSCGLSTRLIQAILPCIDAPDSPIRFAGATDQTVAMLELECARLTERIEAMTHSRDAVATYLEDLRDIRYPATRAG